MRKSYAEGMMRDGGLDFGAASSKAQRDLDFLFPDGVCPDEQSVYVARKYRRRGFGKQAMLFVEDEARRRGLGRVALNVFGANEAARDLYRSLGYEERAVSMSKAV